MSNSRLVINNQKIKLIENRNSLQIKKGKLILNEDVTSISADQAFSMISDTGKSLANIGEGIVKTYLAQVKLSMKILLIPLSGNLSNIISSYEQDIGEVNKLFLDSIPSNVQNTSQFINISNNASQFVFSKVFDNLKQIEGIDEIINAKNITDFIVPPPLQNVINGFYENGKDIPSGMWQTVTKDLPDFFKIDGSSYGSFEKESSKLRELNDDINSMLGYRQGSKGSSGLKVGPIEDKYKNLTIAFVNKIFLGVDDLKTTHGIDLDDNKYDDITNNIMCILLACDQNKKTTPPYYSAQPAPTWSTKAENNPPASSKITRFKFADQFQGKYLYITIKRDDENTPTAENCFFCFDDGTTQKTPDCSFSNFF